MSNLTMDDLEKMLDELSKNKNKDRRFTFHTGTEGIKQFNRAMEARFYEDAIKNSDFSEENKKNLYLLLRSSLEEDYELMKEIINAKSNR